MDQKMYQSLHNESERLIHMVEQLEQLKEWDYFTQQTYSEKEPMDMQFLVEQSVGMFRWSLKNAGIKVEIQAESGIVNVYNEGIPQVMNNLLDNAIRYYEGTGPIRVKGEIEKGSNMLSIGGPDKQFQEKQKKKYSRDYIV
ncbi:HAMP domain-containing histidine kinase (plasmid) [Alkalihalobacillus hwajinpoensis]|uniref:HAMP domain-containing histidine kinase n=1 Tax=Guptibacillus hwajinpoensis TaxID=208199 RepID=UPI0018835456|nr:HAMP domain-containing histidine kinase [Pseudalkalibacillus hwajinpoensis]MBF0706713.1 HAMP domain-containing histidine kinase [Pseudalkalibacillus hwajinpoensis]